MDPRKLLRPYSPIERVLIVTGFALAGAVASFATVMLTDKTHVPTFPGSEYMNIFSRPAVVAHGRPMVRQPSPNIALEEGLDPTPIGSVRRPPELPPLLDEQQTRLSAFSVRGMYAGKALVQFSNGFLMVEPGSDIPGAGLVEKIEFRGGEWIVLTNHGFIGEKP